jgi:hypothetical protein
MVAGRLLLRFPSSSTILGGPDVWKDLCFTFIVPPGPSLTKAVAQPVLSYVTLLGHRKKVKGFLHVGPTEK